jgi:hypothetical protein
MRQLNIVMETVEGFAEQLRAEEVARAKAEARLKALMSGGI